MSHKRDADGSDERGDKHPRRSEADGSVYHAESPLESVLSILMTTANFGTDTLHVARINSATSRDTAEGASQLAVLETGCTRLHYLASQGNCAGLEAEVALGADINAVTARGLSALGYAIEGGHRAAARLLLRLGARADGTDDLQEAEAAADAESATESVIAAADAAVAAALATGRRRPDAFTPRPLHQAILQGDLELVGDLIAARANVRLEGEEGVAAFGYLVRLCGTDLEPQVAPLATALLDAGLSPQDTHDALPPLSLAVDSGSEALARLLLQRGADVNHQPAQAERPLIAALERRQVGMVRLLLEHGADATLVSQEGEQPLAVALLQECEPEVAAALTEALLGAGAEADWEDDEGSSLVHAAADAGYAQAVRLLVQHGLAADEANTSAQTPLHRACAGGHVDAVRVLRELAPLQDVDGDGEDDEEKTPMALAIEGNHTGVVRALLERGDGGDYVSGYMKNTAVAKAVQLGDAEGVAMLQLLLEYAPDLEVVDCDNNTPLVVAVRSKRARMVELLLKHGADANADAARMSLDGPPLRDAVAARDAKLASLLMDHGARADLHTMALAGGRGDADTLAVLLARGKPDALGLAAALAGCAEGDHEQGAQLLLAAGAPLDEDAGKYCAPRAAAAHRAARVTQLLLATRGNDLRVLGPAMMRREWLFGDPEEAEALSLLLLDAGMQPHPSSLLLAVPTGPSEALVSRMIAAGCDVNAQSQETGESVLLLAARDAPFLVQPLLAAGARVDSRSALKLTPLHAAAQGGDVAGDVGGDLGAARALLAAGAEVNAGDQTWRTPLHFAQSAEMAQLLLQHGADVLALDRGMQSALQGVQFKAGASQALVRLLQKEEAAARAQGRKPRGYRSKKD